MLDNMLIFIFSSYNHNFMILICIQPNRPMIFIEKHKIVAITYLSFSCMDYDTV